MAESIVKVPSQEAQGLDFLAFSFNGKHSWDDFHIYRTSDGDRYNENLTPTLADKTAEVPGGDGMYYFGTTHKQRDFNISFAFDGLTEVQLRELKKWLNGKEMGDLWFQEAPYKVWTAKPAGNSSIKYIPFDDENGQRVYKGEGTVQFVAYWPYAHTPDKIQKFENNEWTDVGDGKNIESYKNLFNNTLEWEEASGLQEFSGGLLPCAGENNGDLHTPFVLQFVTAWPSQQTSNIKEYEIRVGENIIIIPLKENESYYEIKWDSKTGLVMAKDAEDSQFKIINYQGISIGTIPSGGITNAYIKAVLKEPDNDYHEGDIYLTQRSSDKRGYWKQFQNYTESNRESWITLKQSPLTYHYWYY